MLRVRHPPHPPRLQDTSLGVWPHTWQSHATRFRNLPRAHVHAEMVAKRLCARKQDGIMPSLAHGQRLVACLAKNCRTGMGARGQSVRGPGWVSGPKTVCAPRHIPPSRSDRRRPDLVIYGATLRGGARFAPQRLMEQPSGRGALKARSKSGARWRQPRVAAFYVRGGGGPVEGALRF